MNMSLLGRWVASAVTSLIVFHVARGVYVISLYEVIMSCILIGLINASIPYMISTMQFSRSMLTLAIFSLAVNSFLIFLMYRLGVGIVASSIQAIILAAAMISAMTWFITLSMNQKLINE